MTVYSVDKLMAETRRLAGEFRRATGKPLAVSAEIARYDAARLLGLELAEGDVGYDALGTGSRAGLRFQVKGRAIFDERKGGQRLGQIKRGGDWDVLVLVLMDEDFEPFEIYEAGRADVEEALDGNGKSQRSGRGVMTVAKFRNIAELSWTRERGPEPEVWSNGQP